MLDHRVSAGMLIFLHVPKAGGSTLHRILEREYSGRTVRETRFGAEAEAELAGLTVAERNEVALLKGHMHFGLHELFPRPTTYVTFLREPVARIVSHYYYVRSHPDHFLHQTVVGESLDLHAYAESGL